MLQPLTDNLSVPKTSCKEHNLPHTHICLTENCFTRQLCRTCKLDHHKDHLRNIFPLSEVYTADFYNSIDSILCSKEETLTKKTAEKNSLVKNINATFVELQNEIETILVETKTIIIHRIERLYQDLKTGFNEDNFQEIRNSLKCLCNRFKNEEDTEFSASLEYFSKAYSRTIESLNSGIQRASQLKENPINVQDILNLVKSSCDTLLRETVFESAEERMKNTLRRQPVRVNPQEIGCMQYCEDLGLFAIGGAHGLLTLWDNINFSCVAQIPIHETAINRTVYLSHSQTLVTASEDNTLKMIKMTSDGKIQKWRKTAVSKPIQGLVSVGTEDKIATVSEKGYKLRLWDITHTFDQMAEVSIPQVEKSSQLLYIPQDSLFAVTYSNKIFLWSPSRPTESEYLRCSSSIVSCCYLQESGTIYALAKNNQNYEEIVWKKLSGENKYSVISTKEIETTKAQGEPLGIVANGSTTAIVFSKSFVLKRAYVLEDTVKFVEILTKICSTDNRMPIYLIEEENKIIITKEGRRIEIYNF